MFVLFHDATLGWGVASWWNIEMRAEFRGEVKETRFRNQYFPTN